MCFNLFFSPDCCYCDIDKSSLNLIEILKNNDTIQTLKLKGCFKTFYLYFIFLLILIVLLLLLFSGFCIRERSNAIKYVELLQKKQFLVFVIDGKNKENSLFCYFIYFSVYIHFVFILVKTNENDRLILYSNYFVERNEMFQTKLNFSVVYNTLIDVCLALNHFKLPAYVILEIVDWFVLWRSRVNRKKKIDCIISVLKSIEKIEMQRQLNDK